MPATPRTSVFSVNECYAYPLLSDAEGELPIYGRGVKCPAIQTISVTKNYTTETLPGDDTIVDTQSSFESLEASVEYGQLDHVLKSIIEGGLNRLLPNESQYIFGGTDLGAQFALKFRATKLGAGAGKDYVVTLWKCTAGTASGDTANASFKTNSFDVSAARLEGKILHPLGNDFELEQVREAGAAGLIDPNTPIPALPASAVQPTVTTNVDGGTLVAASPATITATFSLEIADAYLDPAYFQVVNLATGAIITIGAPEKNATPTIVEIDANITNGQDYALVIDKNVATDTNLVPLGETKLIRFSGVPA